MGKKTEGRDDVRELERIESRDVGPIPAELLELEPEFEPVRDVPQKAASLSARRLASVLDQVRGLHPAHATVADALQAAPLRGAEEPAPARTHKSKAERRAARRKET